MRPRSACSCARLDRVDRSCVVAAGVLDCGFEGSHPYCADRGGVDAVPAHQVRRRVSRRLHEHAGRNRLEVDVFYLQGVASCTSSSCARSRPPNAASRPPGPSRMLVSSGASRASSAALTAARGVCRLEKRSTSPECPIPSGPTRYWSRAQEHVSHAADPAGEFLPP